MKIRCPHLLLLGSLCMQALPQARAVSGSWDVDADGLWSNAASWSSSPTAPGTTAGDVIHLTKAITTHRTVTIDDAPRTVGILNIDSGSSAWRMTLAHSDDHYLLLDNNGAEAQINLGTSGSPQSSNSSPITAPIRLTTGGLVVTTYGVNVGISGPISAASAGTKVLRVGNGSGVAYFRGVISDGNGKVAILNDGTQGSYFGAANTFSGGVTVQRGSIRSNFDTGFGTGTITIGTTLSGAEEIGIISRDTRTYGNNIVISSNAATATAKIQTTTNGSNITYTGDVEMQKALTLQLADKTLTTFSGAISGAGSLTLENSVAAGGTATLSGLNTYQGATTVKRGIALHIDGDSSGATGAITVSGVNAVLGGSGTIGGAVTISTSATLGAGSSTTGILTIVNNVTIANTGGLSARINGATAGGGYDQIVVTGAESAFSLTGTNDLKLTLGYTPQADTLFFLINMMDAGSSFAGMFDTLNGEAVDLSQGAVFSMSGNNFRISYTGDWAANSFTGGNDLVLQAVPEPMTGMLMLGGWVALGVLRRQRSLKQAHGCFPMII